MKAIDLFCGCGGLSVGLKMAGFEVIAGLDIESKYLATFSHNFGQSKAFEADLSQVKPQNLMEKLKLSAGELDLLVGGPPCQGFSKNVPKKNRSCNNANNLLVKTFLEYCEALKPRMILMENVAEMKNSFNRSYSQETILRLEKQGYTLTPVVLNAADYGVPQRRRRAFFLANREGINFEIPPVTHYAQKNSQVVQFELFSYPAHITVWEAIGDLPSLDHGAGEIECPYACKPFTKFQKMIRKEQTVVRNHISRALKPLQYKRLASLKPGQGLKDLPVDLQVKGGYSGAYGRLTKDMIAPTITRWVFHPGSGRWGHPIDIRTLTIREIARLQSFPDDFEFVGSYNDQAGQLGNAVPPLLTKKIVQSMVSQLSQSKSDSNLMKSSRESFSSSEGKQKVMA
ncbi:DNA cytosine methyltransferase [Roseofilum sp. BLCC_M154]|uniref:Cytosine-specific methyltransferase n=1 Tax=Roseofilum acuticapitatum BLCC-M154 TaxID=3022444 RepID=A0ABT7ARQ9_9CYAN|nr:DNA cytosine methyltransferase [Roseofilum acuticapitatum]MDJ1169114.1 DNA cytosine methyltransferase [Roseofilum acuticapitatum BLCC-M154]